MQKTKAGVFFSQPRSGGWLILGHHVRCSLGIGEKFGKLMELTVLALHGLVWCLVYFSITLYTLLDTLKGPKKLGNLCGWCFFGGLASSWVSQDFVKRDRAKTAKRKERDPFESSEIPGSLSFVCWANWTPNSGFLRVLRGVEVTPLQRSQTSIHEFRQTANPYNYQAISDDLVGQ